MMMTTATTTLKGCKKFNQKHETREQLITA